MIPLFRQEFLSPPCRPQNQGIAICTKWEIQVLSLRNWKPGSARNTTSAALSQNKPTLDFLPFSLIHIFKKTWSVRSAITNLSTALQSSYLWVQIKESPDKSSHVHSFLNCTRFGKKKKQNLLKTQTHFIWEESPQSTRQRQG